jgi:SPP1 family phage portal protein
MIIKPIDREFNVEAESSRIDAAFLGELISTHKKKIAPKYRKYQRLYENKHKILNRPRKDENKPNNRIANDFFSQIIDNTVGYFLGNPIILNYTEPHAEKKPVEVEPVEVGVDLSDMEDTSVQDELDSIFSENDKDDLFIEWGKEAMIKGLSHVLVYQNEESKTRFMRISPEDCIIVYKNSSTHEAKWKIRLYDIDTEDTKKTTHYAEVYDANGYDIFTSSEESTGAKGIRNVSGYTFLKRVPHIYGRIPIVTLYNNEEQMSDLERIESLVNDYDKVLSDMSNEFEAFRNAYLMLKNMVAGKDALEKLKAEGILEIMENGDAKFLTKEIQTDAIENHLDRLEKNIYKFSQVPDLSDENFAGNLSGIAIRFKLFGLETKCIIKERKLEKAIKELFRVMYAPLRVLTGHEPDVLNLKVEFTRNVPNNITEIVDTVCKLEGKVDKETLLALLPFVDNPKEVLEKLKADIEADKQSNDPYSMENMEADMANLFPNLNALRGAQNGPLSVVQDNAPTGGGSV